MGDKWGILSTHVGALACPGCKIASNNDPTCISTLAIDLIEEYLIPEGLRFASNRDPSKGIIPYNINALLVA